jgi:hypothetical protein
VNVIFLGLIETTVAFSSFVFNLSNKTKTETAFTKKMSVEELPISANQFPTPDSLFLLRTLLGELAVAAFYFFDLWTIREQGLVRSGDLGKDYGQDLGVLEIVPKVCRLPVRVRSL